MCLFVFIVAAEMSEGNMCSVFRDIYDVDWPLISQKLCLNQVYVNDNCLKHALKQWHKNMKGDPWTTWRKLAVIVGSVYGSKAGQDLRQLAGVGTYVIVKLHEQYSGLSQ